MFRFIKSIMHRIVHKLVFKGSLTGGTIQFYGFGEVAEKPFDGQVIVLDTRCRTEHICSYRFDNRHLASCNPHERCLALWHALMTMDAVRPLAVIEGDTVRTPYGPAQPMPRRFKKLFELEQERLKNAPLEDYSSY